MDAIRGYREHQGSARDEALDAAPSVGALYGRLLGSAGPDDLERRARFIAGRLAADRVAFGGDDGWPFTVDQIPRLFAAEEWSLVDAGLRLRVAALEAFVADVHGPRRCVSDGVIPAGVLDQAPFYEPDLNGIADPPSAWITVAGIDLVRGSDGELYVLEDNTRTPSGLAYAMAAAGAVRSVHTAPDRLRDYTGALEEALRAMCAAAMPAGAPEGAATVMVSDGVGNTAWWEHRTLARLAGVELLHPDDLRRDGDQLVRAADRSPIGVIYRRTDVDCLRDQHGARTQLGDLVIEPLLAGTLAVLNAPGAGVADDKRVHAYVDDLTRYYLGDEPLLRSVPTLDLGDPAALEQALSSAGSLVFKPRDGHGGHGVVIGSMATPGELDRITRAVRDAPANWVAQQQVDLSTHPTVIDGALAPRHVDLRAFALATGPRQWTVLPGGLTRAALADGEFIVNSSRGGGGKDTWVLG